MREQCQKPTEEVRAFWDSTAAWRLTYFDELKRRLDSELSPELRAEKEFILSEDKRIMELVHDSRYVLELGCGVGRSLVPAVVRFPDTAFVGIDFAPQQVALFEHRIRQLGVTNARTCVADVSSLPVDSGSVDLVLICNQTYGTLLDDTRRAALREIARVLRTGGRLLLGGFSNLCLAERCYAAWGVGVVGIDHASGFVRLDHYNSLWQSEETTNAELASIGMRVIDSVQVSLGYINTYEMSSNQAS